MKFDSAEKIQTMTLIREWLVAMALCLCTSTIIVFPFFWRGASSGHDFEFHAASWMDVATQWREGIFYPHWTKWTNHGFGEPRFIFYPPFSWTAGAALSFVMRWKYVPIALAILSQTIAGLAAFALIRRMTSYWYAIFGALCYAANPNALLMIYMRSDYAELLACAFFPLAMLGALQLAGLLKTPGRLQHGSAILLALSYAAVWLSNAPAGVIISYTAAGLFFWAAWTQRNWRILVRGGAGLALGMGLAAFYLAPAAYEQKWVNIGQALSVGLLPAENFLFTKSADVEHTTFNFIASTIALALMLVCGLAAGSIRANRSEGLAAPKCWPALTLMAAGAAVLMFRVTLLLWEHLPKLRFVQFPWRFMSILAMTGACLVAGAAAKRFALLWMAAMLALISVTGVYLERHTWWDPDDLTTMKEAIDEGQGFDGTDEYDPKGDDHSNLPVKAPLAQALPAEAESGEVASIRISRWATNEKKVMVMSHEPVKLALRILNYPAWSVTVNGAAIKPESAEDNGQMIIPLEAGESSVNVKFSRTPDQTVGAGISLGSLLLLVGLATRRKKTAEQG
jgi:hypothetical protein